MFLGSPTVCVRRFRRKHCAVRWHHYCGVPLEIRWGSGSATSIYRGWWNGWRLCGIRLASLSALQLTVQHQRNSNRCDGCRIDVGYSRCAGAVPKSLTEHLGNAHWLAHLPSVAGFSMRGRIWGMFHELHIVALWAFMLGILVAI